jgi:DNA-binding transcriptional regulator YhcF (GntR family)
MFRVIKPTKQALDECLYHKTPKPFTHHPMWQTSAQAMHTLLQMYDFGEGWDFDSREQLAKQLGKNSNTLERHWKKLTDAGLIRWSSGKLELYPFADGSELPEVAEERAPEIEEDLSIAEEVAKKAKRPSTGMSQADRWEAIKLAWNTHKPEGYMQLDGRINLPALIAVETQTKRLGIDRDDYDTFIGAVLRGAAADSWWSSKELKLTQVFGFGADLEDKKFESVERLYKAGLKSSPAPKGDLIDWTNDQQVLRAADLSVHNGIVHSRVSRIRVKEGAAACLGQRIVREQLAKHGRIAPDEYRLRILRESTAGVTFDEDWIELGHLVLVYSETSETPLDWNVGKQFSDDPMIQRMPSNS